MLLSIFRISDILASVLKYCQQSYPSCQYQLEEILTVNTVMWGGGSPLISAALPCSLELMLELPVCY